jgi:alginate O-acetyltransferase complex protein AlgJ
MSHERQPLPRAGLSREAIAHLEVGHTTVAPATVRVLLIVFLSALILVPLVEWAGARALRAEGVDGAWSHLAALPGELARHLAAPRVSTDAGLWRRTFAANRVLLAAMSAFDSALEDESSIGRTLRPPAQILMTGWLGAGNERVYPGQGGWLFYRPDVDYVAGPGFLEPAEHARRAASTSEWAEPPQPDPRRAILRFARDLEGRGISLIVVPTPLKPGVHPEHLSRRYADRNGVLQNPSYPAFVDDLRRGGVLVFDPSAALAGNVGPHYLATDTHWRPETMELAAESLASVITALGRLPPAENPKYRVERVEVANRGDTARMLDLPAGSSMFPPERVWLRRVLHQDGSPWRPSRQADVLVLGDSFSNVYTLESMGWGTAAGFVEHLSLALGRPVDRLVQNDQGAFATRALLSADPDRLEGKRLVVYQFAARELAFGNWKEF